MRQSCFSKSAVASLVLTLLAGSGCPPVVEDPLGYIVPVDGAAADGRSYADLVVAWNQWFFSIPADRSPSEDQTGEFAAEGQSGNVWFLAGTAGGEATRQITVPSGKELFFPILVGFLGDPLDCPGPEQCDEAILRADLADQNTQVTVIEASIDGQSVLDAMSFRVASPPGFFTIVVPPDGVFDLPEGTFEAQVADGWWLLLEPLPDGEHIIQFRGVVGDPDDPLFLLAVTYNLTMGS